MSYRDDHDAAVARGDALEADLEAEKAAHDQDRARIAELEAKLADKPEPPADPNPRPVRTPDERTTRKRAIVFVVALCLTLATVITVLVVRHLQGRERTKDGWDVASYLADAYADARDMESDAEIQEIWADYVDSAGRAQLGYPRARLVFNFRSPHLSADAAPAPRLGAPGGKLPECIISENIDRRSASLSSSRRTPTDTCGRSMAGDPKCSVVEIWQRALAKGAPADALADISFSLSRRESLPWQFEIKDRKADSMYTRTVMQFRFADDCHQ